MFKLNTQIYAIIVSLSFLFAVSPAETFAQNNLRIEDRIGGNGNTTQTPETNDNTFIYVAGGLIVAGIIAYALFIKKNTKHPEADTTALLNSNLIYTEVENPDKFNESIEKAQEKIPVDLIISVKNNELILNDKIYFLGLRIKL